MPSRDEHLAIARRNEAAAATNQARHPEWAVTMLFYAALHYVEAYWDVMYAVHGCKQHYEEHRERRDAVDEYLHEIYRDYRALERLAHESRYGGATFTEQEVKDLRSQRLERVKRHILDAIKPPRERQTFN